MEINVLNNKIKEIVGNSSKDDIKVLNFIFERLSSEEYTVRPLNGNDCKVLYEIKKRLQNEIGELIQTSPLPLSLFSSENEMGNMLFFLFMCCFQNGRKDGVIITTEGKEFISLDQGQKNVLFYLRLLLMRTKLSRVKIVDSSYSITEFFKLFEEDFGDIVNVPIINEDIFYGVCGAFGYGVIKNRIDEVALVVVSVADKETIVKLPEVIEMNKTAGIFFNEDDFGPLLNLVNDYEKIKREKRIRLEKTDEFLGQGSYGYVVKGKITILRKNKNNAPNINYDFDNEDDFFTEEVAIKTIQTDIPIKDISNPQYEGQNASINTEIYTWLQLHKNQYVHPEDFDTYARMKLPERQMCGLNRDHVSTSSQYRLPGNVSHGILPIYLIYVTGGKEDMSGKVCVNFVSPLMAGDVGQFSFEWSYGNFKKIRHRLKKQDLEGYIDLCKNLFADMVSGIDTMHNNTEYTDGKYKSFLHSDVKVLNYLWCLRRPLKIDDNNDTKINNVDFIVLVCDFGFCNKLVQSKYRNQYKIIGENVDINKFYTPIFKPRTMIKIKQNKLGNEIENTMISNVMHTKKEDNTEEKRLLYGFSEIADFQGLALAYLYMLSGFQDFNITKDSVRDKWFPESEENRYSLNDLMRLLVDNDHWTKNDTVIPDCRYCSFVSSEMFELATKYKYKFAFLLTVESDYEKFLIEFFVPYSYRGITKK